MSIDEKIIEIQEKYRINDIKPHFEIDFNIGTPRFYIKVRNKGEDAFFENIEQLLDSKWYKLRTPIRYQEMGQIIKINDKITDIDSREIWIICDSNREYLKENNILFDQLKEKLEYHFAFTYKDREGNKYQLHIEKKNGVEVYHEAKLVEMTE